MYKNHTSRLHILRGITLSFFSHLNFVWSITQNLKKVNVDPLVVRHHFISSFSKKLT